MGAVARYNLDGSPDLNFGNGGMVTVPQLLRMRNVPPPGCSEKPRAVSHALVNQPTAELAQSVLHSGRNQVEFDARLVRQSLLRGGIKEVQRELLARADAERLDVVRDVTGKPECQQKVLSHERFRCVCVGDVGLNH